MLLLKVPVPLVVQVPDVAPPPTVAAIVAVGVPLMAPVLLLKLKPAGNAPGAGQTLRRRYTNVWMRRNGKWLLTARQASIICPS